MIPLITTLVILALIYLAWRYDRATEKKNAKEIGKFNCPKCGEEIKEGKMNSAGIISYKCEKCGHKGTTSQKEILSQQISEEIKEDKA